MSTDRFVDGWAFVSSAGDGVPAVWGEGDAVLWAAGEPFTIVGPDGVGKTSLAQQVVRARIGLGRRTLCGLPITRTQGQVLYVAADRPPQAARSMRRMYEQGDEETLRDHLLVHRGPIPVDLVRDPPGTLLEFVQQHENVDTVVFDSLKDIAVKLTDDEVGASVNRSMQELVAAGIETLVLHHQRKAQQGASAPKTLADVYGSRWLTAGMGSVALLWGEAGDPVVSFRHLKQPAEEVGPFNLMHDHVRGRTMLHDHTDLEQLLGSNGGLTVKDAARLLFGKDDPKANEIEKARRRLEGLVGRNRAEREDDSDGTARYVARKAA